MTNAEPTRASSGRRAGPITDAARDASIDISSQLLATRTTLNVREAAAVLGIGAYATYGAIKRGELPVLRFGRRIVVPVAALQRLLNVDGRIVTPVEHDGVASVAEGPRLRRIELRVRKAGSS